MTIQFLDGAGGYTAIKEFPDGRSAGIYVLSPDCVRLKASFAPALGVMEWCYDSEVDAIKALQEWTGKGEPKGWGRRILTAGRSPG